jgi:hypothetical protein
MEQRIGIDLGRPIRLSRLMEGERAGGDHQLRGRAEDAVGGWIREGRIDWWARWQSVRR